MPVPNSPTVYPEPFPFSLLVPFGSPYPYAGVGTVALWCAGLLAILIVLSLVFARRSRVVPAANLLVLVAALALVWVASTQGFVPLHPGLGALHLRPDSPQGHELRLEIDTLVRVQRLVQALCVVVLALVLATVRAIIRAHRTPHPSRVVPAR